MTKKLKADGEGFAECLSTVYAAAADGVGWGEVARDIKDSIGTDFANVLYMHRQRFIVGGACSGLSRDEAEQYLEDWRTIAPHLRSALCLRERLNYLEAKAQAADQILRESRSAALICDDLGTILELNAHAELLLRRFRHLLRTQCGRLRAIEPRGNARLQRLLATPACSGEHAAPTVCLRNSRDHNALDCTVLEFPTERLAHRIAEPLRIVLLRPSGEAGPIDRHYLRHRLGITRAESDVLARLMAGANPAEIAEARGSTVQTIRSYLKALRRRLGCHSQAQLVAWAWQCVAGVPGSASVGRPEDGRNSS